MTSIDETPVVLDPPTAATGRSAVPERTLRILVPLAMLVAIIALWFWYVRTYHVPTYILPAPDDIVRAVIDDWSTLSLAWVVTLKITFSALALALIGGVLIAVLLAQSKWLEIAISPYLVVLQVTPVVAVAPLILIYAPSTQAALLLVSWIVAFFPVYANTAQGLKSTDHNLLNLFELYGANRWKTLFFLQLPAALPSFLTGLRIGGGLALIAAVVAEFAAGSAGAGSGLAFRLIEAQYRLKIPRLFAALLMLCATGILIFAATRLITHLCLRRWHESAIRREN